MMPLSATFEYVCVVPDDPERSVWTARLRTPVEAIGNPLHDHRLVGYAPVVQVVSGGMTPDDPPGSTRVRPKVLRSRIILTSSEPTVASTSSVALHVDRALTAAIRPRDVLSISRTSAGGVGLSVIRDDKLAVAVGAITAVPLGPSVRVRIPWDLVEQATAVFWQRDGSFRFHHAPVEIEIGTARKVAFGGRSTLGEYEWFVEHGCYRGLPGRAECVAISSPGFCSDVTAICSAQLIDYPDSLEMAGGA